MTSTLGVSLHGKTVGYLSQTAKGQIAFRFTEAYLLRSDRPILSQSFEDNLLRTYYGKNHSLPSFFANLIPEHGELRNLIEGNLGVSPGDDLALLEAVGRDLPGAVEIVRMNEDTFLDQENLKFPSYIEDGKNIHKKKEPGFRFSLAGVQMKFSVLRDPERITLPASNQDGEWIVKLGSTRFPFTIENEYAIMQWAKSAGFDVPECYLQDARTVSDTLKKYANFGNYIFVIRRYDRQAGNRIHQEDFAQVTNLQPGLKYDHIKYEQCGALIKQIVGDDAYYEFIRRLTFVIASGNADAHLKNWSLLYLNEQHPSLAPMYDQVCTIAWPELSSELALKLAGTKNWFALELKRFESLASRVGADPTKTTKTVEETLVQLADTWTNSQISTLLPQPHLERLQDFWRRVPLLRPFLSQLK
ncbi:HipA domain-containing protein [Spirulina major CS-329]|uniref:type II toxin-antitoxin system HipA family toxin n=1 Tax=Spirulina TaxID=1154 RepID=UPI00232F91D5|nr:MULTISPECIES: HipA domain-containing protein [Spirulina]MDB9493099.1 HipA domain-containing protein [Spirulina subsalsa CS-330]MDB9503091.1 HipA domain-containing protein [Spirulina major CS-329]